MKIEYNVDGLFSIIGETEAGNEEIGQIKMKLARIGGEGRYRLLSVKDDTPRIGPHTLNSLDFVVENEEGKSYEELFPIYAGGGFKR